MSEDDRPLSVLTMACSICCLACMIAADDDVSTAAVMAVAWRRLLVLTAYDAFAPINEEEGAA